MPFQRRRLLGPCKAPPKPPRCTSRNGSGLNPTGFLCTTPPILGEAWLCSVPTTAQTLSTAVAFAASAGQTPFGSGEILVALAPEPLVLPGSGQHSFPLPMLSSLVGAVAFTQGLRIEGGTTPQVELFNGQDLVLGY